VITQKRWCLMELWCNKEIWWNQVYSNSISRKIFLSFFFQLIKLFINYATLKSLYWQGLSLSWNWWWPSQYWKRWSIKDHWGLEYIDKWRLAHFQNEFFENLTTKKKLITMVMYGSLTKKCKSHEMSHLQVNVYECVVCLLVWLTFSH
jgi:hypothetical protein